MKRKLKFLFKIFLIVVVTCCCVALGFKSRYDNGIVVTQFQSHLNCSMGYMLESKENKIIMIDGGLSDDSKHVEDTIISKGGIVDAWFITCNHEENAVALVEIIKSGKVQINNIYVSLNSSEWYETYEENLGGRKEFAIKFLNILDSENIRDKVQELALRQEFVFDNLNFKILKIKAPEQIINAGNNQSVVIKVSNNFKSIILLGDLGSEFEEEFLNNNLDEIEADWILNNSLVDGSSNGTWKTLETRTKIEEIGVLENYAVKDEECTVRIW